MELAEDGEKSWETAKARKDFQQSITADSVRGLGQVYGRCLLTHVLFLCVCISTKILSVVPLLDLNPHWLSSLFSCAIVRTSLFSEMPVRIWSARDSRGMPWSFLTVSFHPLSL